MRALSDPSLFNDWERKILFSQMIGLELPGPASFSFHLMFSVGDQVLGRSFSEDFPLPEGPLKAGQFSA
jgi:hypothetical protein